MGEKEETWDAEVSVRFLSPYILKEKEGGERRPVLLVPSLSPILEKGMENGGAVMSGLPFLSFHGKGEKREEERRIFPVLPEKEERGERGGEKR